MRSRSRQKIATEKPPRSRAIVWYDRPEERIDNELGTPTMRNRLLPATSMTSHKRITIGLLVLAGAIIVFWLATGRTFFRESPNEKLYVAVEGDGTVAVIDPKTAKGIRTIDLAIEHDGGILRFAPHNIQASPDGTSIWVTANAGKHEEHAASFIPRTHAHGAVEETSEPDELVVIDPGTDRIAKRFGIAPEAHLAHVVFSPDGATAWVTSQMRDAI